MRRFVVFLPFVIVAVLARSTVPVAAQDPVLRPPVDADVLDPFRSPDGRYGPGNRGIEYDTDPGQRVRAAGPGVVAFAGPVAGSVYVSIDHGGGLRSSYGPLTGIRVAVGDQVDRASWVASTVGPVHFSTRIDGEYVDPAALFGVLHVDVRLIQHATDDGAAVRAATELGEREALYDLVQSRGEGDGLLGAINRLVDRAGQAIDPRSMLGGLLAQAEILLAVAPELTSDALIARMILGLVDVADPPPCTSESTAGAVAPPAERRIAIVIDGLDSSTADGGIRDELSLGVAGYADDDIVRFSYAGGLAPGGASEWGSEIPRSTYRADATYQGVELHIGRLEAVLQMVRAANPGVSIDVYGHSLGGVVARHAIAAVNDTVDVSVAVTLASPHEGTSAATVLDAAGTTGVGGQVDDALHVIDPDHRFSAPVLGDLSERGFAGDRAHVAFPDSVHAVTIGARTDIVVPADQADAAGADHHVVVGGLAPVGAHGEIAALPTVHREVRLAIAGMLPACTGIRDRILDLVVPEAISTAQRAAAVGIIAADHQERGAADRPG